jgi:hypothetical protein
VDIRPGTVAQICKHSYLGVEDEEDSDVGAASHKYGLCRNVSKISLLVLCYSCEAKISKHRQNLKKNDWYFISVPN